MAYTGNGAFGGLDARRAAADGAIRDMGNMSLRYSPAIASRLGRRKIATNYKNFQGAYYGDREYVVRGGKLYDDGTSVYNLRSGEKSMAMLENNLWIFPDKIRYNTKTKTAKNFNANLNNIGDYQYAKPAYLDYYYSQETNGDFIETEYYAEGIAFGVKEFGALPFVTGEMIKIKITRVETNTGAYRKVDFELITVPTEISYESYSENYGGAIYVIKLPLDTLAPIVESNRRKRLLEVEVTYAIPEMDGVFASDNRLWGYKGREMYCSALGDGSVWMDYDTLATSSWAATTKTGDDITAGVDFGGTPVFFAENAAYKIYGENPKEFQYARQDIIGVTKGDHKSVAVGAGYIFYLSRRGIYAWTGGVPQLISAPLGEERITDAVGGSDGAVYYLSCKQDGRQNLYVFDPMTFAWVREDDTEAVDIRLRGRDLCMVTRGGDVHLIGDVYDEIGAVEDGVRYYLETADYNDGAVTQKSAKNILIQHELAGGEADVCVSYDGEPWNHVYTLYDTDGKKITSVIPLREKRYRTMRIRIEGDGEIVIYYMMRDVAPRTERTGGEKNVYK